MPEPFTLTVFATIAAHGLFSHGAAHGTAAVVAHAAAAKGAAAVAGHAAAGHLGTAALVGATITASTLGGATFLNVYNNTLDDLYKNLKRRWKRVPTPGERQEVLAAAYRNTRQELSSRGILSHADKREMRRIYLALAMPR